VPLQLIRVIVTKRQIQLPREHYLSSWRLSKWRIALWFMFGTQLCSEWR